METSQITDEGGKSPKFRSDHYEILTDEQIGSKIIEIIKNAEEYCCLVSPYFKNWHHLDTCLKTVSSNNKRIIFFFREDQTKREEIIEIHNKYNFDVFFIKDLHAKIYMNEHEALITSMNMYDYSHENNFEIGVLIHDKHIIKDEIENYIINYIYNNGKNDSLTLKGKFYSDIIEKYLFFEKVDYCVYCGKPKKQIKNYLYCDGCKKQTSQNKSRTNFKYCNICGLETKEYSLCSKHHRELFLKT
jgi:hypothetical protein